MVSSCWNFWYFFLLFRQFTRPRFPHRYIRLQHSWVSSLLSLSLCIRLWLCASLLCEAIKHAIGRDLMLSFNDVEQNPMTSTTPHRKVTMKKNCLVWANTIHFIWTHRVAHPIPGDVTFHFKWVYRETTSRKDDDDDDDDPDYIHTWMNPLAECSCFVNSITIRVFHIHPLLLYTRPNNPHLTLRHTTKRHIYTQTPPFPPFI